jgi:DNA polymerase-3 subunit epsilon
MFAIVDIETTGSVSTGSRITEVAVVLHDGKQIEKVYETLINPGAKIPRYITRLTGISDDMVRNAPLFAEVADEIEKLTSGRIFVAHNVHFDYSFLQQEFKQIGRHFNRKMLCTVKLGRKLAQGHRSYSLGNFCSAMGIEIQNRHRAAGDAIATAKLFGKLVELDKENIIEGFLKKQHSEFLIPPNLDKITVSNLPEKEGVYYFVDQKGKVIYVGKANNIKKRILSHFTSNSETRKKGNLIEEIFDIQYTLCGNELISLTVEASEIKRLWPKYNYALKNPPSRFGLTCYEDRNGYLRLGIKKLNRFENALKEFRSVNEAREHLKQAVIDFSLCDILSNLQPNADSCAGYADGTCGGACNGKENHSVYNEKVKCLIDYYSSENDSWLIEGKGRNEEEKGFILIENGRLKGYGFYQDYNQYLDPELLKVNLNPLPHNDYVLNLVNFFLETSEDYHVHGFTTKEEFLPAIEGIGLFA